MYKIEYDIIPNALGRPSIELSDNYDSNPEDKFFAFELTRYILQDVYVHQFPNLSKDTAEKVEICINLLGQLSDEMAILLWDGMKVAGDAAFLLNSSYHIKIKNIEQLNRFGNEIYYDNKVFRKKNGLKVFVSDETKIYEYKDDNWIELQ